MTSRKKIKARVIAREQKDTLKAQRLADKVDRVVYEIINEFFNYEYTSDNTSLLLLKTLPSRLQTQAVKEILKESGDLINDKLDYIKSDFGALSATGATIISQADRIISQAVIEANIAEIEAIIGNYTQDIIRQALLANISGKKIDYPKIHNDAKDSFVNKVYSNTINTADGFERGLGIKKASDLNLKYFIYEGGLIQTSRPFCVARAGKIFTVEQLKSWDNGQKLPVIPYLGGWNCRHHINWISDELAQELSKDISMKGF